MAAQVTHEKMLKSKLEELSQLGKLMCDYVDQMIRNDSSWIDSKGSIGSYQDVLSRLESSIKPLREVMDKVHISPEPEARAATPTFSMVSIDELLKRMDALEHKGETIYSRLCSTDETVGQMDEKMKSLEDRQDEKMKSLEDRQDEKMKSLEDRQGQFDDRLIRLEKEKESDSTAMKEHQPDVDKTPASAEGIKTEAAPVLAEAPSEGFTASMPADSKSVNLFYKKRVTCFTNVISNPSGHYDPATCIYTIPVTGWYRVKLSHSQSKWATTGDLELVVIRNWKPSKECFSGFMSVSVCGTNTWGSEYNGDKQGVKLQAADENVVDLGVGDQLYVQCVHASTRLLPPANFSCELLEE